jgi:hypothetical protein
VRVIRRGDRIVTRPYHLASVDHGSDYRLPGRAGLYNKKHLLIESAVEDMDMKKRVAAMAFALAVLGPPLGCGGLGGGGSSRLDLMGTLDVDSFVIPPGQTRRVVGNLRVNSKGPITIAGTLLIQEGFEVILAAEGPLVIDGEIAPDEGRASSRGGDAGDLFFTGSVVDTQGKDLRAPQGSSIFMAPRTSDGQVRMLGANIRAGKGRSGVARKERGQNGGSVDVGSQQALAAFADRGITVAVPSLVLVISSVRSGAGGDGAKDEVGVRTAEEALYESGDGGDGGDVRLDGADVHLGGGHDRLISGWGGSGGAINAKGRDGVVLGESGENVRLVVGKGGNGGDIRINGELPPLGKSDFGQGGIPGAFIAEAGNGAPSGDGGNLEVIVGNPGVRRSDNALPNENSWPEVRIRGGNGGAAAAATTPAGQGGTFWISSPDFTKAAVRRVLLQGAGKGGDGYNGCKLNPTDRGSNGGTAKTLTMKGLLHTTESPSFTGGHGGHGDLAKGGPGMRGIGGFDDFGNKLGQDGNQGLGCEEAGLALVLGHDLDLDGVKLHSAGSQVRLERISGFETWGAHEPFCSFLHLHVGALGDGGIRIDGIGPFADPDQGGCGFGHLILVGF